MNSKNKLLKITQSCSRKFGTNKIFLIIFIALGFAAAVKETIFILKRVQENG